MSEFKFSCPQCGQHIPCDPLWSGREINCPACQQALVVPSLEPPGAAVAELMPVTPATAAGSTPGTPSRAVSPGPPARIPLVVRIYGILTMAIGVLGIVIFGLYIALRPGGGALGLLLYGVVILLMVVVYRVGSGMRSGEHQGVYGFCLLALIDLAFRVLSFANTGATQHLWTLALTLVLFYLAPLVSAFRHWPSFK
ncbi:MAG: hypothetical protein NT154_14275 [Verrucomicrobia bacterium]|nr:hypothetical protein [Verrucomicrobiota bacterium]